MALRGDRLELVPVSAAARLAGIRADPMDVGHGIASFKGGTGELISALTAAVSPRTTVLLGAEVVRLTPRSGGWRLTTGQGHTVETDAAILAVPAAAAARLVAPFSSGAAALLASFDAVSDVSVSLAYPASAVGLPPDVGGFVSAAGSDQEGFRACDFSSAKFPGRVPPGFVLLRTFFRPGGEFRLDAPDSQWVEWAVATISPVLGIRQRPARSWVARWPRALPRYAPNHQESLRTVAHLLGGGPPLELAGAAYQAAGIAGALESAQAAARGLMVGSA
jgi:oxygen-dependent protoporphyrinogen oxidase